VRERNSAHGIAWRYVKVPQAELVKLQATDLADVALAFGVEAQ